MTVYLGMPAGTLLLVAMFEMDICGDYEDPPIRQKKTFES